MCVDMNDNELVTLEGIHLFVEILDHYFQNVCELDLVFNFHKVGWWAMHKPAGAGDGPVSLSSPCNDVDCQVYLILDEFMLGGEFQETAKKVSLESVWWPAVAASVGAIQ